MKYVIAKKNSEFLDTPVFHAGPDDSQEAVALFTSRDAAQRYIADAGWGDEYEVGELAASQLARWIGTAQEQGSDMLVVDPDRQEHLEGKQQKVFFLHAFGEMIEAEIDGQRTAV